MYCVVNHNYLVSSIGKLRFKVVGGWTSTQLSKLVQNILEFNRGVGWIELREQINTNLLNYSKLPLIKRQ